MPTRKAKTNRNGTAETKLLLLNKEQWEDWDAFVASHVDGTIYHERSWNNILEQAFRHIKGYIFALIDPSEGNILAGMPLYSVNSWLLGNRLVCSPFSTWCNPLVSNQKQLELLLQKAVELARKLSSREIVVRLRNGGNLHPPRTWTQEINWKHHTVSLRKNEEELWNNLHLNAIRQLIKRSKKNNVEVIAGLSDKNMKVFYEALVESRKRLQLPMIPWSYFSSMLENLSNQQANVLIAKRKGVPLGACLIVQNDRICHLESTGEYPDCRGFGAMQALIWNAILNARENGCLDFSFGRTTLSNDGLIQYKNRWGATEEDLSVLRWKPKGASSTTASHSILESFAKTLNHILPRSLYKRFGSFVYSHWG